MRQRPVAYRPDPEVVVLDIDEASLAAMNAHYGRWPWPRKVLSPVAARLEAAKARAVVFDILFTDPDMANLESESAFDRYVSASRKSFFPAIRLNPKNDSASEVPVSMLNFAQPDPKASGIALDAHRTLAIMTPYFKSIYESARVGTSNIYPDSDNIVRWYSSYEMLAGYRIPSLPYRVAEMLHWPLPKHAHNLINWPQGRRPYRTISFCARWRPPRPMTALSLRSLPAKSWWWDRPPPTWATSRQRLWTRSIRASMCSPRCSTTPRTIASCIP